MRLLYPLLPIVKTDLTGGGELTRRYITSIPYPLSLALFFPCAASLSATHMKQLGNKVDWNIEKVHH